MTSPPLPIFPQKSSLVGIARLASEGESLREGHNVEYFTLTAKSLLNRCVSKRAMPFTWTINPYRGCEFGCRYCYARYTHGFFAPGKVSTAGPAPGAIDYRHPDAFERIIFLKQNAAWLLEQDLRRIDPASKIALGTATDPYQPIERKVGITRSLLEV